MRPSEPLEDLSALQAEVQRGIGRCLLNLQLYEQALKVLLSISNIIAAPAAEGGSTLSAVNNVEKMTLGGLISAMLGTVLRPEGLDTPKDNDSGIDGPTPSARFRFSIAFTAEKHALLETGLRELVTLRNALVHNFVVQNDLNSAEGCRIAITTLEADRRRIITHLEEVRAWLGDIVEGRAQMIEAFKNEEIVKTLTREAICWPLTSIVQGLQEAERALAESGWTSLSSAQAWMSLNYPEEIPSHYDCRTWPQLLHETRLFDLSRPLAGR